MCRASGLVVLVVVGVVAGHTSICLNSGRDGTWTVRNANNSVKAAAKVPGGIYTDLRAANILKQDFFYRFNDELYRWVAQDNWTYTRSFDVYENLLEFQDVQLVFHGLDTVAEVVLNEATLGFTDNMFVRYVFPVRELLVVGSNTLKVKFLSPILAAKLRYEEQSEDYEVPPRCVPDVQHGECHVNHLRKMQASFSWDWGPAFPSVGIWKDVELEAFNSAVLRSVTTDFKALASPHLHIGFDLETHPGATSLEGKVEARLRLFDEVVVSSPVSLTPDELGHCNATIDLSLPEDQFELWWPNGMGSHPLYNLTATFKSSDGAENSSVKVRVGLRTIELVQNSFVTNGSDMGLTFFFRVNGRAMFSKGSNWIPASVFPELTDDPDTVYHLLNSARIVNMNMLRVWGGGVYESDYFYELADEMGLLIWQDMMFACSMYPATDAFLSSVREEVRQQVKRLQHHASIALWAGNNENEAALRDNWYGTGSDFEQYKEDYVKLYVETIMSNVSLLDSSRPFVTSSPSNGVESEKEGYVAKNPSSHLYGDNHYYNYILDGWDPSLYPTTRFASEYGYQSLPALETLLEVTEPMDRSAASQLMSSRQHHAAGYQEMALLTGKRLPLPQNWTTPENFYSFIYYSQISQAMSVKTETEWYRRSRTLLTTDGEGLTMGALYWQLNDVWQAPTWASIDVNGRWKMLHYYAVNFFAPVLVSPYLDAEKTLHVYVVSDLPEEVVSVEVRVSVGRWNQLGVPPAQTLASFTLAADTSQEVFSQDLQSFLTNYSCPKAEECYFLFSVVSTVPYVNQLGPDNVLYPSRLQDAVGLYLPNITVIDVTGPHDGSFTVQLFTNYVAPFVWLETCQIAGRFSENGFLMANATRDIVFYPFPKSANITATQLLNSITVNSLLHHA